MSTHLHKRFTESEVIEVFERYLAKEIEVEHAMGMLGIGRSRFFNLVKEYRQNPDKFSLEYKRSTATRSGTPAVALGTDAEIQSEPGRSGAVDRILGGFGSNTSSP